jgi:hypothetical protein
MRVRNFLALLTLCACLAGCSRVQEVAMPVVAKINAAHPVSPEARLAGEHLLMLVSDDAKAVDAVKAQMESRMALRALNCSKNVPVGRLDTVSAVKKLPMDETCFQEQDGELQKFYAVRTIGVLLAKPALRPRKAGGPMTALRKSKLSFISSAALARDAGVGVLLGNNGGGVVVEMPGGALIAQLPDSGQRQGSTTSVSPNGRVVASNAYGEGPEFIEAETGNRIWSAPGGRAAHLLGWLPEVSGFVLTSLDGDVMLADGLTGRIDVHPLSIKNATYAANIPGQSVRLLMGTAREFVLMEHTRGAQGIVASAIRQYKIESGPGMTSGKPVPMRSGHMVVYNSLRDIGWLDLDSGASGTWHTSPLFYTPFAKLDESHILFDSTMPSFMSMSVNIWSFDIASETVAPSDIHNDHGPMIDIGDRVGFLRRVSDAAWFGDAVTTGEAQSLDKMMAQYELQRQLENLQAQAAGEGETIVAARGAPPGATAAPMPAMPVTPGMEGVPADAQVQMIGIYEPKGRSSGSTSDHSAHSVRVEVHSSMHPMVLVLASYEAVNWVVVNTGAQISAVLLSGYNESTVHGTGDTRVLRIGSAHPYAAGSAEYVRLQQAVAQYAGTRAIRSFQGSYTGSEFMVGGN